MNQAYICDAIRTPFGRYGGALSSVRTDDLGAIPIRALMARNPALDGDASVGLLEYGSAKLIAPSTEAGPRWGDGSASPARACLCPRLIHVAHDFAEEGL